MANQCVLKYPHQLIFHKGKIMLRKLSCLVFLFSQIALAYSPQPEGDWKLINKICNSKAQTIVGNETVFLRNSFYAQSYISFEDEERICTQAQGFDRIIQTVSSSADGYEEISNLNPKA